MSAIDKLRAKYRQHLQELKKEEGRCYVCGKKVNKNPVEIGQGKVRHKGCKVGTKSWLKHRKNSELYKYFKGE